MSNEKEQKLDTIPVNEYIMIGSRHIIKQGDRYVVFLPIRLNWLWKILNERRIPLEVHVIIRELAGKEAKKEEAKNT